jgi:acetylornithine deacetylase/succinyl-diaminopimelate desuccinylase-like protein
MVRLVPDRIFFRNTSYDAHERIFRGEICWEQEYGTTWLGFRKWIYEMRFDSNYTYIAGTVHSLLVGSDEPHESFTYGNNLVYMNAAVDEYFTTLMMIPGTANANADHRHNDDEDEEADEQISHRFTCLSLALRQQWASEGASVRLIAMLHSVLTKVIMGQESPVDFNLVV